LEDRAFYAAAVFYGAAGVVSHLLASSSLGASDYLYAGLSSLGAVVLAGLALFHQRVPGFLPRVFTRRAGATLWAIRGLNSGRVGDYVAWIAVGVTVFGGAFALTML